MTATRTFAREWAERFSSGAFAMFNAGTEMPRGAHPQRWKARIYSRLTRREWFR